MTTPLKPGDPVLVEAVYESGPECAADWHKIVKIIDHEGIAQPVVAFRVHPLPAPVWVVYDCWTKRYLLWRSEPTADHEGDYWSNEYIDREVFDALWPEHQMTEHDEPRRVRLLAIPAKEGE